MKAVHRRTPTSISKIRPCIKIAVTLTILAVCPTIEAASDRWKLSATGMPSPPQQMRVIFSADDGSAASLVMRMISADRVSPEELEMMQELIKKARGENQ